MFHLLRVCAPFVISEVSKKVECILRILDRLIEFVGSFSCIDGVLDVFRLADPERSVIIIDEADGVQQPRPEFAGGGAWPLGVHSLDDLNASGDLEPFGISRQCDVPPRLHELGWRLEIPEPREE